MSEKLREISPGSLFSSVKVGGCQGFHTRLQEQKYIAFLGEAFGFHTGLI